MFYPSCYDYGMGNAMGRNSRLKFRVELIHDSSTITTTACNSSSSSSTMMMMRQDSFASFGDEGSVAIEELVGLTNNRLTTSQNSSGFDLDNSDASLDISGSLDLHGKIIFNDDVTINDKTEVDELYIVNRESIDDIKCPPGFANSCY